MRYAAVCTVRACGREKATVDGSPLSVRAATAQAGLDLAPHGVRSSAVRLAPTCHGEGDNGFMATLAALARDKGLSGYVGDGANRWPAVHRLDAARLFRPAVEEAPAGSGPHGVEEEGIALREIAEVIGRHLGVPAASVAREAAGGHFTWLSGVLGLDAPASNTLTRELLGWEPAGPGLLEDLGRGHYFRGATAPAA